VKNALAYLFSELITIKGFIVTHPKSQLYNTIFWAAYNYTFCKLDQLKKRVNLPQNFLIDLALVLVGVHYKWHSKGHFSRCH
jgi:hypothetical protein